jgi:hypothetical protein
LEEKAVLDDHERSGDTTNPGLVIGTVLALFAVAGTALVQQVQGLGPNVGDIVAFDGGRPAAAELHQDVRAFIDDMNDSTHSAKPCVLALQSLVGSGGSIVVEAVDPNSPAPYRIHLAGGLVSGDHTACAANGSLLISQEALVTLATAAGGIGTGDTKQLAGLFSASVPAYGQ